MYISVETTFEIKSFEAMPLLETLVARKPQIAGLSSIMFGNYRIGQKAEMS